MIAQRFQFTPSDSKLIERILEDDHAAINHVVLAAGGALPEHATNSNVYLIIVRGAASIRLAHEEAVAYPAGTIVKIPFQTVMNLSNQEAAPLEFFIVKAPSPKMMNC